MADARAVANYFINKARKENRTITHLKLQKMLYFAHGWYLALTNTPLMDEPIQAWRYGPVISSVYHEFKPYGSNPIDDLASNIYFDDNGRINVEPFKLNTDPSRDALLDKIWDMCKDVPATTLSNMTHASGTPWRQTWQGASSEFTGAIISNDTIRNYFKSLSHAK